MDKVEFPAVLVLSRVDYKAGKVIAMLDGKQLESDADLTRRLATFRGLEMAGGLVYTYTLTPVATAEATAERVKAELELTHGLAKPTPTPPADPLDAAIAAAAAAFAGNAAILARLSKAADLVKSGQVQDLGGGQWQVMSGSGKAYQVNGSCQCEDYTHRGGWCKHRLAVALVRKARAIENGLGTAANGPSPEAPKDPPQGQDSTEGAGRQAVVELVVNYLTDEARERPRMDGGELVSLAVDGKPADPPTRSLPDLYRLLAQRGYLPAAFRWLEPVGSGGKRQRLQTYARAATG